MLDKVNGPINGLMSQSSSLDGIVSSGSSDVLAQLDNLINIS